MKNDPISILVVDDHPLLLSGLCLLLNAEPDMTVAAQASTSREAIASCAASRPDIILLDISLNESSGLDLIPELLDRDPGTRIIILTMHEDRQYLRRAMEQGARGFVLKKGLDADLLYAIRSVMRGQVYVQPSLLEGYIPGAPESSRPETADDRDNTATLWDTLSHREQEVLLAVAKGFTSKEIANRCLLSEKTVATYRSRGMTKLDLTSRAELVELVLRLGKLHSR